MGPHTSAVESQSLRLREGAQNQGAVFTLVGSIGIAAPVVHRAVLGSRSAAVLEATDRWMSQHSTVIVAVVLVVLGVLVVVNGVTEH